jgi:hypothetical protein
MAMAFSVIHILSFVHKVSKQSLDEKMRFQAQLGNEKKKNAIPS